MSLYLTVILFIVQTPPFNPICLVLMQSSQTLPVAIDDDPFAITNKTRRKSRTDRVGETATVEEKSVA